MARGGTKFPLMVYQHLLGRWWSGLFGIGIAMLGLAYTEYLQPLGKLLSWRWQLFAAVGVLGIFIGIFFLVIRQVAYVQAFPDHLKIVTPFMRVNVSYKRFQKTTTTEMRYLFPPKSMSGWVRDIFDPLANKTAMVIELKGYPVSPVLLRLFFSRFFFKDKTPHFVILVKDWMRFSSELESMQTGVDPNPKPAQKKPKNSILSRLPQK
jgi:hypothetical protein